MADVAITLPTGEAAMVPQEDLSRALDAGATAAPKYAPGSDEEFVNSGLGQGLTGVLAAGRAASGGATDVIFKNLAGLVGGKSAERSVSKAFLTAKEANPLADLGGEVGGMFLGGGGLTAVGEAAEAGIAARVGEGLLGKVAAGAGRGAAEGAYLGVQHQITEDTIGNGDHALSGEALFATTAKEALLGGAIGAATGAAGYGLGRLFNRGAGKATEAAEKGVDVATDERATKGLAALGGPYRASASAVDELVGAKGAAGLAKESAKASEAAIESLQKTGRFTSEQAAHVVDGANRVAEAAAAAKDATPEGIVDAVGKWFAKTSGGKDPEAVDALMRHFDIQRGMRGKSEDVVKNIAVDLSKDFTSVVRKLEDTANDLQFAEKPQQMRRLLEGVDRQGARDATIKMFQEVQEKALFLDSLASKGGKEGALRTLMKEQTDLARVFQNGEAHQADYFIAANKLKQSLDRAVGKGGFATRLDTPEAVSTFKELRMSLQAQLENEGVWGAGGRAQAQLNKTYSDLVPRRSHLAQTVGQTIDRGEGGVQLLGGDFQKFHGMLKSLSGDASDAEIQGVKSVEAWVDGLRARVGAVKEHASLSPKQLADVEEGEKLLAAFSKKFNSAREEVAANNRVRSMQLVEREGSQIGGLVGMIGDVFTKPLTTLDRLASVGNTVSRATDKVRNVVKSVFSGAAEGVEKGARGVARSADATAKEIGHITELASNPERMSSVIHDMFSGVAKHAPQIATEARATAIRAVTFLANEAPIPVGSRVVFGMPQKKPRYSDAQLASWQAKRDAAMGAIDGKTAPEVIVGDLQKGRLNRDAIRTIEFVSPRLFAEMQQTAQEQITKMAADGKLDKLTLAQQASIASLLKVPPGEIWKPDFMLMMQAAKSAAQQPQQSQGGPMGGQSKRAIKMNTDVFQTDAQAIEAR
jgi:hypothetical protein